MNEINTLLLCLHGLIDNSTLRQLSNNSTIFFIDLFEGSTRYCFSMFIPHWCFATYLVAHFYGHLPAASV